MRIEDTVNSLTRPWLGRFPKNEIISLLDVSRQFNLAESTAQDLTLGELLDLVGADDMRSMKLGYGSSAGLLALREAVGEVCEVPASFVITTQGTALALFLLAFELCRPGDEVVLTTPCFPPSCDALVGCDVVLMKVPLSFDEGYRLDVARVASALSPRTRLVSLATPQNPSGVRISEEDLLELLDVMADRAPGAFLFVDETYREAVYGDAPVPRSAASLDPRVITGGSISKAHGAPGLRVGWLTSSDADLRERLTVAKMNMVISGSALDESLAAGLLRRRGLVLGPRRALLSGALKELSEWHRNESHRVEWVRPDGGALCCMRLAAGTFDDRAVARFWDVLPSFELQLASGAWFGEQSRVFRLGFGYLPPDRLAPALKALSQALTAALK